MQNYETLQTIGEGTYGVVVKAKHKETGQIVAIKKFKESDSDEQVRKTALREVRILKQLKHDNIVNLIEVFRRKDKLYLVFEYVDRNILEELEKHPTGLSELELKKCLYQLLRAVDYCHENNILHRDIKPENILVSKNGSIKLCDFGFARALAGQGAKYTDYVATRWYRAPELLVGDTEYGKAVDIWAIGCNAAELSNGIPLFPGESDIDQLFHIIKCFGTLTQRQMEIFQTNPMYTNVKLPVPSSIHTIEQRFGSSNQRLLRDFLNRCLHYDPDHRDTCATLLQTPFFKDQGFETWVLEELRRLSQLDANPLLVHQNRKNRDRKSLSNVNVNKDEFITPEATPHSQSGLDDVFLEESDIRLHNKPVTLESVSLMANQGWDSKPSTSEGMESIASTKPMRLEPLADDNHGVAPFSFPIIPNDQSGSSNRLPSRGNATLFPQLNPLESLFKYNTKNKKKPDKPPPAPPAKLTPGLFTPSKWLPGSTMNNTSTPSTSEGFPDGLPIPHNDSLLPIQPRDGRKLP